MRSRSVVIVASVAAGSLASAGSAGEMLLDIPSGYRNQVVWSSSQGGFDGPNFSIQSQYMAFSEDNWATPGNVYAWDWDTYTSKVGSATFTADEGYMLRLAELNVSGWGDYLESAAEIRIFADDQLVFDSEFLLAGSSESELVRLDSMMASSYRIELENIGQWASVGLDNIVIQTSAVPAPGALALLGLSGIVGFRRRRR